jgi:hypothetical protein
VDNGNVEDGQNKLRLGEDGTEIDDALFLLRNTIHLRKKCTWAGRSLKNVSRPNEKRKKIHIL